MTLVGLIKMAGNDLAASRARAIVSSAGIALGVAVLMIIAGLGLGARELVLKEVVRALPVDVIEVIPKSVDFGLFKVDPGALFGEAPLNPATLARLRALPGVAAAYPKLEVSLPLGAQGGMYLFKRRLYTDIFMTALPTELVQAEVGPDFVDRPDFVPVVVSDQLLEIYNATVAPAIGGPRLTTESLKGFRFELVVGRSLMLGNRGAAREGVELARVVGVSHYAMRLGVTVPLETARRLRAAYGEPNSEEHYASILLRAESASDVPRIREGVQAFGLAVDETARRTGDLITAVTLLASLVGLLVLALAALNIAHSFFASLSERKRELAILRATGARRVDLVLIVLAQAAMLGVIGGVSGTLVARLASWLIDAAARQLLPNFPFKPESFFLLPLWLNGVALVAAMLAACLGALWPAVRAARASLVRALSEV